MPCHERLAVKIYEVEYSSASGIEKLDLSLSIELIDALKRSLKAQGITYKDLAQRIGISEAAIKRMFSVKSIQLHRIEQICDVLGLGLSELAATADRARQPMSELNEAQEQALVDDPALLLVMFLVLNRWRFEDMQCYFSFSEPEWVCLLARLDRLGIIEMLPGNRGRPLTARNFRWRCNGPMEQHFRRQLLGEYFAEAFTGEQDALYLLAGELSHEGVQLMREHLQALAREFDALLLRDATLPTQQKTGICLVLAQKPWMFPSFAPYLRSDGIQA
ncbi:transcriptional regulator [Lysobacteraceae bacterium NML03-0222]|nr:transcriptional regulator [Xanthomonadaceae bacterium NML03-0222]